MKVAASLAVEAAGWALAESPLADGLGIRVGVGYDLHRLVAGRRLVLGGVEVPFEKGPAGHSDADVVLHAVIDALLGATGLGDIGELFPDTDPRYKDADSRTLLTDVAARVRAAGWRVGNVDVIVHMERPKLSMYKRPIAESIAALLGVDAACVSVKAKTNEGLAEIGRGEAVACTVATLLVTQ